MLKGCIEKVSPAQVAGLGLRQGVCPGWLRHGCAVVVGDGKGGGFVHRGRLREGGLRVGHGVCC